MIQAGNHGERDRSSTRCEATALNHSKRSQDAVNDVQVAVRALHVRPRDLSQTTKEGSESQP